MSMSCLFDRLIVHVCSRDIPSPIAAYPKARFCDLSIRMIKGMYSAFVDPSACCLFYKKKPCEPRRFARRRAWLVVEEGLVSL